MGTSRADGEGGTVAEVGADVGVDMHPASAVASPAASTPRRWLFTMRVNVGQLANVVGMKIRAPMTLLLLEALGALVIFLLIVWWTMFSGRPNGELPDDATRQGERKPGEGQKE